MTKQLFFFTCLFSILLFSSFLSKAQTFQVGELYQFSTDKSQIAKNLVDGNCDPNMLLDIDKKTVIELEFIDETGDKVILHIDQLYEDRNAKKSRLQSNTKLAYPDSKLCMTFTQLKELLKKEEIKHVKRGKFFQKYLNFN